MKQAILTVILCVSTVACTGNFLKSGKGSAGAKSTSDVEISNDDSKEEYWENVEISEPVMVDGGFLHCNPVDQQETTKIACSVVDGSGRQKTIENIQDDQIILETIDGKATGIRFTVANPIVGHWLSANVQSTNLNQYRINPINVEGLSEAKEKVPVLSFPSNVTVSIVTSTIYLDYTWLQGPYGASCRALCTGRGGFNRSASSELIDNCENFVVDVLLGETNIESLDFVTYENQGKGCFQNSSDEIFLSRFGPDAKLDIDWAEDDISNYCICNN